jgi:hypothetical protein
MSDLLNKASLVVIPSGYKEDTVYSVVPSDGSGDLSFTRASNGTRVNSAGLVEVCPWNLAQYSEDFSNAAWTKARVTITANDTTAPNGTTTADKVSLNSGTNSKIIQQVFNQNGAFTQTVYAKAGTHNFLQLLVGSDVTPYCNFDLVNGTYSASGCTASITSVGNGWFYLTMSYSTTIGTDYYLWAVDSLSSARADVTSSTGYYYLWGFQLNIGSTAKPYFPTTDRLNVPRLTYQNGGGGCPSLLLEKQSTNLAVQSNAFNTTPWVSNEFNGTNPVITANYGISPDGTQNASRIILERTNSSASYSQIYQYPITTTIGQQYTWSVWLKSLSGTPTISIIGDFGRPPVTLTNEWVRYTGTGTASAVVSQLEIAILGSNFASGNSLTADFLAWGYQFEASSYPTSYIPTTASSATRVADACFKTGISSLIGQTEGTMFVDFNFEQKADTSGNIVILLRGSGSEAYIFLTSSNVQADFISGGIQCSILGSIGAVGRKKIAFAYKQNDFALYMNGVQIGTDSSGTVGSLTALTIGSYDSPGYVLNSGINQATLFKTRLTNAELASLTTI